MVRLSKLADYGLVLMACMARSTPEHPLRTARDLADESKLPLPTVARLLKTLLQHGLLFSHRGIQGGYTLARDPRTISVAEVVAALEGPIGLTECSIAESGVCDLEMSCAIKKNQRIISQVVRGALQNISLANLIQPMKLTKIEDAKGDLVPAVGIAPGRM